ncbi:MAG: hypothetical protein KTR19_11295 [Hyphomicrobiales bacterium]|nr:hypothetical protein [Hyphomicrobiales bacterium]
MRGFHNVVFAGVVFTAFSIIALPAQAVGAEWDHNNSTMKLIENGKKRRFIYEEPRSALKPAGVTTGTILFDGEEKGDGRLSGYAKLFRKGCNPIDYFVEGSFDRKKGEAILQGQAPIYSGEGCKITGYTDSGKASRLHFVRLGGDRNQLAGIPNEDERPSYLPPASGSDALATGETRDETARTGQDIEPLERESPGQRSASRIEQETFVEPDYAEPYGYDDDRDRRFGWRNRRAARDSRYADEDSAYYSDLEDNDDDDSEYYEDDDFYDDGAAYFSRPPRY